MEMLQYDNILKSPLQIAFNVGGAYVTTSFANTSQYNRAASVAIGALAGNYIYNVSGFALADELVTNPFAALSRTVSDIATGKGSMVEYAGAGAAGYGAYQATIGEASTEAVAATEAAETSGLIGTIMEGLEFLSLLII
jgi:hypothetical protein